MIAADVPLSADERKERLERVRGLIESVPVCMVTTNGVDGSIHSRPMAYLDMESDGELVFFTRAASTKSLEVRRNRQVNVSFCEPASNRYVSVSGRAIIINDRERIVSLFTPIMMTWFPAGAEDPTLRLFLVHPSSVEYWDGPSALTFFFSTAKSFLTGGSPEQGEHDFFEL